MAIIASVVIDGALSQFDRQYSYVVPEHLSDFCTCGKRVVVPFGRSDLKKQGVVMHLSDSDNTDKLKSVLQVLDASAVLNEEMISLCEWMREQIFCTYFDAIHACVPFGLNHKIVDTYDAVKEHCITLDSAQQQIYDFLLNKGPVQKEKIIKKFSLEDDLTLELLCEKGVLVKRESAVRNVADTTMKMVHLCEENLSAFSKITKQQKAVIDLLSEIGDVSVKEVTYFTGVGASVISTLQKNGLAVVYEREVFRVPQIVNFKAKRKEIVLTDEQNKAYNSLLGKLNAQKGCCELLYGVTGSGKTQVFLKLVDSVVDSGKGVIVMVPEISLTPQTVSHFANRYGNKVAVFHSAMSPAQRMDEWKRVKNGEALVAIGTRSAVFAPFDNIGLIIMDEEQEHTYKSEKSPKFHARNVAKFRANYHNAMLLLASATPSLESFSNAVSGKYGLNKLTKRYSNAVLPEVTTVDMRAEILSGNSGSVSRLLYNELSNTLENKQQAILLLNRRGYKTYVSCPACGYVASCPNCSITLTYHNANKRLMCHYCGYSKEIDSSCPECNNEHLRFYGLGTQKLEEELQSLFGSVRVLRLDADTTLARDSFSKKLTQFANGEYDILIGTQMVAKGLDFPNVTLVGVIGADQAMYSEDYRSFERMFSLLTQVVGRAGRGDKKGKAVIQTVSPDSQLIKMAVKQDYEAFYNTEILTRKLMIYPPFCDMVMVASSSSDREEAFEAIKLVFDILKNGLETDYNDVKAVILGPSVASIPKISNRYRYRMLIKCRNNKRFRELLRKSLNIKLKKDTSVSVDINPETII